MRENKELIIKALHDLLLTSRHFQDLEEVEYVKNGNGWYGEQAIFTFSNGRVESVNITGDNCTGIMIDVLKHFGFIRRDADV